MNQALWVAKTGLDAQQTRMSVIANNLANANTTGFKRGRAEFQDLMYQNVRQVGAQTAQNAQLPTGLNLGTGVRLVATEKLFTQGNSFQTGNPLDMEIEGRGFFQVALPDGSIGYTRDGSFHTDSQGQLVDAGGNVLQPPVTIPSNAQSITIGRDGVVSITTPGAATPTQVGSVQIADFINPTGLQPAGNNIFLESAASGSPQTGTAGLNGFGSINQGSLESSNINIVEELVNMIEAQRSYEMSSKAISTANQMMQFTNNNL